MLNWLQNPLVKVEGNQVGWLVEVDAKLASENPLVKVDANQLISINFDLKPI